MQVRRYCSHLRSITVSFQPSLAPSNGGGINWIPWADAINNIFELRILDDHRLFDGSTLEPSKEVTYRLDSKAVSVLCGTSEGVIGDSNIGSLSIFQSEVHADLIPRKEVRAVQLERRFWRHSGKYT